MRHGIGYHRAPSHGLPPAARNMNAKLDRKSSGQRHPSTVLPGCPRASLEDVNISHKSLPSLPAQRQICTHLDKASTPFASCNCVLTRKPGIRCTLGSTAVGVLRKT